MVSLIVAPNHFLVGDLNFPFISVRPRRYRRLQRPQLAVFVNLDNCSFGFLGDLKMKHYGSSSSLCCWCKGGWESEGDLALEAEIMEFMKKSEKPEVFPTKEELVDAKRMDLVEAIVKRGGWLSLGWDLADDNEDYKFQENRRVARDCDGERFGVSINSSQSLSSSGRSIEMGDEEETGVEGILSGLEKQRNLSFGISLGGNGYSAHVLSNYGDDQHVEISRHADSSDLGKSSRLTSGSPDMGIFNNSGGKFCQRSVADFDGSKNSLEPEMWRTWSIQRAGFSNAEFEAGEISFNDNQMPERKDALKEEFLAIRESSTEAFDKQKEISHNAIQTRLQHLELELASALCLLRSKSEQFVPKEGHETTSNDLQKLSDAWEFQENEIMNVQDTLRSIRAKLAVLEGKMALAIIDAQKTVEGKQKRIDGACRALQLLRTAYIVWPNSASEVLLAGSYDGWTTKRKMEKSNTGIFSVCLKLYPGRYEIKFIVDGAWRTDPLRPIVRNNGYDNNLLIIT